MPHSATRTAVRWSIWLGSVTAAITLIGAASVVVSGWLINAVEAANGGREAAVARSGIGEYFGAVSAVFSGLALLMLVVTLLLQQQELRLQRSELADQRNELAQSRIELHRSAEADLRGLHVQLTRMTMDDPSLAVVWGPASGLSPVEVRQNAFANLAFGHILLAYRWGSYTESDIRGHVRVLAASVEFRRYWDWSRSDRAALPLESDEHQLALLFDEVINEMTGNQSAAGPSTT